MTTIIGIDLGTTNSLCGVFRKGQPELIPNAHGQELTPSVVGILPSGEIVVGATARELAITHPDRVSFCFKRLMGESTETTIAGHTFSPVELSSLVLKSLRDDAINALGEVVEEAVISVPAYFNDHQRKATKQAAELAGLRVRRIVNEPTAAALAYGFHDRDAEKKILVVDLGGGTFDVTLMEIFEGTLEIISTAGESQLGGEDFTNRLVAEVLKTQGKQIELAELQTPLLVSRLRKECELAKRTLSGNETATIRIPNEDGTMPEQGDKIELTPESFATAAKSLLDRIAAPIDRALRDGQSNSTDVEEVILVGGATRMPLMARFVEERLGKLPLTKLDPDRVVCLGAAVQAALIADDRAVEDMVMTDVCPFTLGINISKDLGSQVKSGYYLPIVHRNTTIPVSKEHPVATMHPNQTTVQIEVYQGEHRMVEKNHRLGELSVKGIPAGPAGQTIFVRFTYDLNGILEVEAYPEGREENKQRVVIASHASDLTEEELSLAVKRMNELKYYPREDQESQRLLRYAVQCVGEVSTFQREQLEVAIDAFEHSMAAVDKELVESSRMTLLQVLSSLGFEA